MFHRQFPFVDCFFKLKVQTQPLDLGISSHKTENNQGLSPKRKASTPVSLPGGPNSPVCLEVKKRRIDSPGVAYSSSQMGSSQPQLARVSEPSPLIASAATTITTVVNTAAYRTPNGTPLVSQSPTALTENLPDVSVTAVNIESTDQVASPKPATPTVALSNSPASTPTPPASVTPGPSEEPPGTPMKTNLTPSVVDSEKSNSPGPPKNSSSASGNYPVRHLKKAWLQRHTGEDLEDTTGVVGSGSCVTLPLNIKTTGPSVNVTTTTVKENPVNSIHSVSNLIIFS